MVNSQKFAERLKAVMEFHGLNGSALADRIGVQRSSISHILSGRNKPSLDFVTRIINEFDTVDLYWLLNGKGSFPKQEQSETVASKDQPRESISKDSENIDRIVIFFKDGSYKSYKN